MFSQYCKNKFTVEPVDVINASNVSTLYPILDCRSVELTVDYISSKIGVSSDILTPTKICTLLLKMGLESSYNNNVITVLVPPSRSDILHPCDIMEDVAIAYGFNNIPETMPKSHTIAVPFPLNKLSDSLRKECAMSGYTEVIPLILCSHDENFAFLQRPDNGSTAVLLSNPKTAEYQVVRTSLIPGILKTIRENRKSALPLRLFEVSDIVWKDDSYERRARNQRNLCAVYCGTTSGFEQIHGLLDRVFQMVGIKSVEVGSDNGYYISESQDPTFFPGRRADVFFNSKKIGVFGILHPIVLGKFEIGFPASCLEIDVEGFL